MIRSPKLGNKWIVPGGHIEHGEHVLEAARREAHEETGLRVRPFGVFTVAESVSATTGNFSRRHFIYFEIICKALSSKVKLDQAEATSYAWFSVEAAQKAVRFPVVRRVIREYTAQRRRGKVKYIEVLRQKDVKP